MKNVLVYGDVMVDRSWIVSGRTEMTVQAHADVIPMRRVAPGRLDDRLGGAGMAAAAVAHLCARYCRVHLLGASRPLDGRILGSVTPLQTPRQHIDDSVTTIKLRIYNVNEKGLPILRHRFDQDAPSPQLTGALPNDLLSPSHLIISDFKKGTVQPSLLKKLLYRFRDAEVLVDTKDSDLFEKCPALKTRGGVLFLNREEAMRLWQRYRGPTADHIDIMLRLRHCLVDLLELGQGLMKKLPKWDLVVKLDRDGAVLFCGKDFYVQTVDAGEGASIGAGDVLLAAWLQASFLGCRNKGQLLGHAARTATAWVTQASLLDTWNKAWKAGREAPVCADLPVPLVLPAQAPSAMAITTGIKEEQARTKYPRCIADRKLDLTAADFGVGKFLILDPSRRREVLRFVRKIREYLTRSGPTRPYNCVLTARPGTGKSFLLRQLETRSLPFYEVNLAQFATASEFMGELARIAARGDRQRILMIDEADTVFGDQPIYSLLLAPLWDGTVTYQGESRSLGSHFVSVLVSSTSNTPTEFRNRLRKAVKQKGPDLESRLSGADLTLTAPRGGRVRARSAEPLQLDADYAILIGSIVRRYYPDVRWVCRSFFDMLYEKDLSPRDLEYALLRLESPADGYIKPEDVTRLRKTLGDSSAPAMNGEHAAYIQLVDAS
jgi:hypothetical protein